MPVILSSSLVRVSVDSQEQTSLLPLSWAGQASGIRGNLPRVTGTTERRAEAISFPIREYVPAVNRLKIRRVFVQDSKDGQSLPAAVLGMNGSEVLQAGRLQDAGKDGAGIAEKVARISK
jgi:hypothetical protein